jgi:hypothetical protein
VYRFAAWFICQFVFAAEVPRDVLTSVRTSGDSLCGPVEAKRSGLDATARFEKMAAKDMVDV